MSTRISNPPDPSALMEAARSFGNYDLALALADLIDNSITAKATKINITCLWNDGDALISVRDNGLGMGKEQLIEAMRPVSTNPRDKRDEDDLGRFGLGLKTASFSQARLLSVITCDGTEIHGAQWDLDDLSNWEMTLLSAKEARLLLGDENGISTDQSMTTVIWRKLDRLLEDGRLKEGDFNEFLFSVRGTLSLIYHRYLKAISIDLNNIALKPRDPFYEEHPATQKLTTERIEIFGSPIIVTPFILPHYSKLTPRESGDLEGEEGYLKNQGFYVYRNRRLIIHGTWFKLVRHGELHKLARVRVDVRNTLDAHWKITVDKSDAQIPFILRKRLKGLIQNKIQKASFRVYKNRGKRLGGNEISHAWNRTSSRGRIKYEINLDHPCVACFLTSLDGHQIKHFLEVANILGKTFPVDSIHFDQSKNPYAVERAAGDLDEIEAMAKAYIERRRKDGENDESIFSCLMSTEPFSTEEPTAIKRLLAEVAKR